MVSSSFLSLFVLTSGSLSFGFVCHPVGVFDKALTLDYAGLPEIYLFLILSALSSGVGNVLLTFFNVSPQTCCQQFFVVGYGLASKRRW